MAFSEYRAVVEILKIHPRFWAFFGTFHQIGSISWFWVFL